MLEQDALAGTLGPMMTKISPGFTSKLMSPGTVVLPNFLVRLATVTPNVLPTKGRR